jgi:hypothetical protein
MVEGRQQAAVDGVLREVVVATQADITQVHRMHLVSACGSSLHKADLAPRHCELMRLRHTDCSCHAIDHSVARHVFWAGLQLGIDLSEGVYLVGTGNTGAASAFACLGAVYFSMMMAGTLWPHCKSTATVVRTTLHCKLPEYTAQYGPKQHISSHLMQRTARRVAFITCHGSCGRHQMLKHTPNDASKVSAALACAGSPRL